MLRRASAVLAALLLACSTGRVSLGGDGKFGKTAEEDYASGEGELRSRNYPEAIRYFEHLRTKYPFSKYAALADLRLADVKYEQDRLVEAADAYAQFVKLHPNHERADYASFRVGMSHLKEAPSDFFLFPPAHEKDLTPVRAAVKSLAEFVKAFPDSKYRPEAEKALAQGRDQLAEHEWYASEFYAKRGHWAGAAARLDGLVREYPGSRLEPAALYRLAEAYLHVDERYRAQQALQQLLVKHPRDPRRAAAEKLLASLR